MQQGGYHVLSDILHALLVCLYILLVLVQTNQFPLQLVHFEIYHESHQISDLHFLPVR